MKYRREIDGLRAVAVLPVILFHAGFSVFSGGYVGVDVFFVISGYLITSILIGELEQSTFSIARFYERRARRILPALFLVMLVCLPFAYLWMLPTQLEEFAQSLFAVGLFLSNWLFWSQAGYFENAAELKPLLHTWSLAVEEQYYLLFPMFLFAFWRFGRRCVLILVVAMAFLSLLLSEWGWRNEPAINFFFTFSRFWELLAGSICAFATAGRTIKSNNILGAAGLVAILVAIFAYDATTPFPSLYTLLPVIGTALVILFGSHGTWVAKLLSIRVFVGIGLISYSAYLWHQPLFAFARLRSMAEPPQVLMAALAVASIVLAWVTWRYVEQPFRRNNNPVLPTRGQVFLFSGIASAAFLSIGLTGHLAEGFKSRSAGDITMGELDNRVISNRGLTRRCPSSFTRSADCYTSTEPNVLVWGDSYAMHLVKGIMASDPDIALQQYTKHTCAPIIGLATRSPQHTADWAARCIAFNDQVLAWLRQQDSVDIVVLSSPFSQLLGDRIANDAGDVLVGDNMAYVAQRMYDTVDLIRATGARVIVVSPPPTHGEDIGKCLTHIVLFDVAETSCDFALDDETRVDDFLRRLESHVPVYRLSDDICPNSVCDVMQDGIFIYRDSGHLSNEGSAYLGRQNDWMGTFSRIAS